MGKEQSLHLIMRPVLLLAQIAGLFPVEGILGRNSSNIRFRKWSPLIFYSICIGLISLVSFLLNLWNLYKRFKSDISVSPSVYVMLKITGPVVIVMPLCLNICKKWPRFVKQWEDIENKVPELRLSNRTLWIIRHAPLCIVIIMFFFTALADCMELLKIHNCLKPLSFWHTFYFFTLKLFNKFFPEMPVADRIKVLTLYYYRLIHILHWAFCPMMSTVIPLIVSSRLRVLNKTLVKHKIQLMGNMYWKIARESYNCLFQLTLLTDNLITKLIFFLCITETFFLVFLIHGALGMSWSFERYDVVLIQLVIHLTVNLINFLSLTSVHVQSKKPLAVLKSLPSLQFNTDVARFYNQIVHEEMTFTGFNFFHITRSFMFTIISTIVTYEVMLIQFSGDSDKRSRQHDLRLCLRITAEYLTMFNLEQNDITFEFLKNINETKTSS